MAFEANASINRIILQTVAHQQTAKSTFHSLAYEIVKLIGPDLWLLQTRWRISVGEGKDRKPEVRDHF